ncbi:MAG: hypothetical protein MUC63_04345, partial [Planctomycetes bacterium]|nr:hypothetical protein [Planctomycetota bacterium]
MLALSQIAGWQREDGLWGEAGSNGGASGRADLGFTSLALLAFTMFGTTPRHGRHKNSVRSGLRELNALLKPDGSFEGADPEIPGIFTQAVSAWVLLEQAELSPSTLSKQAAGPALARLLRLQNADGSWSSPLEPSDLLHTSWAVLALSRARRKENPEAREAVKRAYGFLLAQLGPDGRVDPWREDRYFARAFGRGLPPRRVQLLSAAALAGIARVRGKETMGLERARLGFEALELDFPLKDEAAWEGGLLEWLWTDLAVYAAHHHPNGGVWEWKRRLTA